VPDLAPERIDYDTINASKIVVDHKGKEIILTQMKGRCTQNTQIGLD
jgi:hypothetical protein